MEIKTPTESVLAKLMGLERPQPNKKLQYSRQRVLSKRYYQKNALICQRRRRVLDRLSEDMIDETVNKNDSDEVLLCSSSSDKTLLERYEKESDKIFQKFRLLNSTLKVETNGYSLRRFNCPDEKECVVSKKPVESLLHQNEKIPSFVRRRDRDFKTHGSVVRHGVAKQVAIELQQSVWHDYLQKLRPVCTRPDFPRDINTDYIRYSNLRSVKFNVHKAEETPLISSDLNEFGEIGVIKDCLSGPPSPTNFSEHSNVGNTTDQAFQMVLDELPDMLQEIDSFRNRVCRKSNAVKQQDADHLQFSSTANLNDISSITRSHAIQGFKAHFQQPTKQTEDTRVMSYISETLAELDNHQLEDPVDLFTYEKLEKKYGEHSSWLRSECKLLFDCISCRLSDILNPSKGIRTLYNKQHKCLQLNNEIIKKEVFDLLANQFKGVSRDSLEVIEGDTDWLELDEQMEVVVAKEIEDDLIDKLVEEIIST